MLKVPRTGAILRNITNHLPFHVYLHYHLHVLRLRFNIVEIDQSHKSLSDKDGKNEVSIKN